MQFEDFICQEGAVYTVPQLAELYDCSSRTIRRKIKRLQGEGVQIIIGKGPGAKVSFIGDSGQNTGQVVDTERMGVVDNTGQYRTSSGQVVDNTGQKGGQKGVNMGGVGGGNIYTTTNKASVYKEKRKEEEGKADNIQEAGFIFSNLIEKTRG